MLPLPMIVLFSALASVKAQFEYTEVTVRGTPTSVAVPNGFLNPTGVVSDVSLSFNVTVPLVCNSVCWTRQAYYGCATLPTLLLSPCRLGSSLADR